MFDGEEMLSDRANIFGHRHLIEIKIEESINIVIKYEE